MWNFYPQLLRDILQKEKRGAVCYILVEGPRKTQ